MRHLRLSVLDHRILTLLHNFWLDFLSHFEFEFDMSCVALPWRGVQSKQVWGVQKIGVCRLVVRRAQYCKTYFKLTDTNKRLMTEL